MEKLEKSVYHLLDKFRSISEVGQADIAMRINPYNYPLLSEDLQKELQYIKKLVKKDSYGMLISEINGLSELPKNDLFELLLKDKFLYYAIKAMDKEQLLGLEALQIDEGLPLSSFQFKQLEKQLSSSKSYGNESSYYFKLMELVKDQEGRGKKITRAKDI